MPVGVAVGVFVRVGDGVSDGVAPTDSDAVDEGVLVGDAECDGAMTGPHVPAGQNTHRPCSSTPQQLR